MTMNNILEYFTACHPELVPGCPPSGVPKEVTVATNAACDTGKTKQLHHSKDQRTWRVHPLPYGIRQNIIRARVLVGGPLKASPQFCRVANQCKGVIQAHLDQLYTGNDFTARYVLRVYIDTLSDGGFSGTFDGTAKGVVKLGEAYLGLCWALWPNNTLHGKESCCCVGGAVASRVHLSPIQQWLLDINNHGNRALIEDLAPEAVSLLFDQVGVDDVKWVRRNVQRCRPKRFSRQPLLLPRRVPYVQFLERTQ